MTPQKKAECPLAKIRGKLKWERHDLATIARVNANLVGTVELGYFLKIPDQILDAITPYLAGMGTTPGKLQEEFHAWRLGLGEEVRERTQKRLAGGAA
jgi:hypothetical protein